MRKWNHGFAALGAGALLMGLAWWLYVEAGGPPAEYMARARGCLLCHGDDWAQPMERLRTWKPGEAISPRIEQAIRQEHPVLSRGAEEELTALLVQRQLEALAEQSKGTLGKTLYEAKCAVCHGKDGQGSPGDYPPLLGSEWLTAEPSRLPEVLTKGLQEPITVKGETWDKTMRAPGLSSSAEVEQLIDYLRKTFAR